MTSNILFKVSILLLLFSTIAYFSYNYYLDNKPVITIYADEVPTKIKPQELEKSALPAIGSAIYSALTSEQAMIKNAKLLPEPEKPINIVSRERQEENIENLMDEFSNIQSFDKISELISKEELAYAAKEGRTKPITEENKTGLNIIKIAKENDSNTQTFHNCSKTNTYQVQLASVKSEAEAIKEAERIKKRFFKILKNADITTKKVQYDSGKFFYLVLAGNYKTLSQAKIVCKKLSFQQQSCVLK